MPKGRGWGEVGKNYQGPAVQKGARGPGILRTYCMLLSSSLVSLFVACANEPFQTKPKSLCHWQSVLLITYSMVQSPSWEANWFAASQEIPCISRNPKVHYRTHKRPPYIPILGQPNSIHIPTSHLLEIHPNIILPFTPRSPQWSLSLRFPH